jgi:hypothetical protein
MGVAGAVFGTWRTQLGLVVLNVAVTRGRPSRYNCNTLLSYGIELTFLDFYITWISIYPEAKLSEY